MAGTCRCRGPTARHPSGAGLQPAAAAPPRPAPKARTRGGRLRTAPRPYFGERGKHRDRNPGPSGQGGGGGRSASPSRGLARPYRSGSGSPPQCCGPRTRTEAPPSSRQGTPRASRTPRTAGVGSEAQRQRGVERAQAMPQGMLGTPLHLFPRPPGPSALRRRGAGREREEGRGRGA